MNSHVKVPEVDCSRPGKDCGQPGRQRALTDTHSNIFVLRKMVEEVFSVLYSKSDYDFLYIIRWGKRKDKRGTIFGTKHMFIHCFRWGCWEKQPGPCALWLDSQGSQLSGCLRPAWWCNSEKTFGIRHQDLNEDLREEQPHPLHCQKVIIYFILIICLWSHGQKAKACSHKVWVWLNENVK